MSMGRESDMNRVWIGAAVTLAVVVGSILSVQQAVAADGAIVIKNNGDCGMVGAGADGDVIFGGIGVATTVVENGNRVMLKCVGEGVTNLSGSGQSFSGFECGVELPSGGFIGTTDTHATVSRSGVGTMTCTYTK
jgi:hypothetical protein